MHTSAITDANRQSRHGGERDERLVAEYREYCARHDRTEFLPDDAVIGVGVGEAKITCDGVPVFEENGHEPDSLPTTADAERIAREAPHRDWRIHLVSLREERHYRRQSEGRWVLYRRGYGLS
jgi:hypothetical protein